MDRQRLRLHRLDAHRRIEMRQHADFARHDDAVVAGQVVPARAKAVAVEDRADNRPVGERDRGRAVPRLHVHGVKIVKGPQVFIHLRVVLPGGRDQEAKGAKQVHAAGQEDFQQVIQVASIS